METANCEFVDFPACVVADCLAKESLNKSEELIIASLIVIFILILDVLYFRCKKKGEDIHKLEILEINSHVYYYNVSNYQSK